MLLLSGAGGVNQIGSRAAHSYWVFHFFPLPFLFYLFFRISLAAFAPEIPVSPVPGCVPEPHR